MSEMLRNNLGVCVSSVRPSVRLLIFFQISYSSSSCMQVVARQQEERYVIPPVSSIDLLPVAREQTLPQEATLRHPSQTHKRLPSMQTSRCLPIPKLKLSPEETAERGLAAQPRAQTSGSALRFCWRQQLAPSPLRYVFIASRGRGFGGAADSRSCRFDRRCKLLQRPSSAKRSVFYNDGTVTFWLHVPT